MTWEHVLVDGDTLVYRCGFAAEKRQYTVVVNTGSCDDPEKAVVASFPYKKDAVVWIRDAAPEGEYVLEKETLVEPVEFAVQNLKTALDHIEETVGCPTVIALGGIAPTFRHELATMQEYKGARKDTPKPVHYDALRTWLCLNKDTVDVQTDLEADDALGILQCRHSDFEVGDASRGTMGCPSIIVSNDKDLDQIPGWHWDWTTADSTPYYVPIWMADKWRWLQVLTGDATDSIAGLPGVGPVSAEKILDAWEPCEWEEVVESTYEDYFTSDRKIKGKDYTTRQVALWMGMTGKEIFEEVKALTTILRYPRKEAEE